MGSTRAYYDVHASEWDALRQTYYRDVVRDRILEKAAPGKLLDVGCGPGFLLVKALENPKFTRVTGADFSNSMLTLLRAKFENGHKLHLKLADAAKLPFPEGSQDAVVSNMVLHHLAEPWNGLSEMARVARPGGTVVFSDLRAHTYEYFRTEMADHWLGFEESEVRRWMSEAGLEQIEVEDAGELTATIVNGSVKTAKVRAFVASGVKGA
jgi:ubiquinone/menaquinone biosynthesis C-methylase UbiE